MIPPLHPDDKRVHDDLMQLENYVLEHVYHGINDFNTSKEDSGVVYYD